MLYESIFAGRDLTNLLPSKAASSTFTWVAEGPEGDESLTVKSVEGHGVSVELIKNEHQWSVLPGVAPTRSTSTSYVLLRESAQPVSMEDIPADNPAVVAAAQIKEDQAADSMSSPDNAGVQGIAAPIAKLYEDLFNKFSEALSERGIFTGLVGR